MNKLEIPEYICCISKKRARISGPSRQVKSTVNLKTPGIVIKEQKINQGDKLLTFLTRDHGVISAYANGSGRPKSRLASASELFAYSDLMFFHHRDRYIVDDADVIEIFFEIRSDIEKLSFASYCAELTASLSPTSEDSAEFLRLLLNTLHLTAKNKLPVSVLKPIFELRSLSISGFLPDLVACKGCGEYLGDEMLFSPLEGSLSCGACRKNETALSTWIPLSEGVLSAMRHIVYSDFEKLFSFRLNHAEHPLLMDCAEQYMLAQTERTYHSLEFFRSVFQFQD